MSIHVYFMPIDVKLIQKRVFDYIEGKGTLDELRPDMIRRANAARGISPLASALFNASYNARDTLPDWYNNDTVTLERPYLITENLPTRVGELVDLYHHAATPEETLKLAESQVAHVNPKDWKKWKLKEPKTESVEPQVDEKLNSLAQYVSPKGAKRAEKKKLELQFASDLLKFNEELQPVWSVMDYFTESIVWATRELGKCFETPHALFEPLFKSHPELKKALSSEYRNETVGLYVSPKNVPKARKAAEKALPTPVTEDVGETSDYALNALRRLTETLCYAERRGLGFAERIT